MSHTFDLLIRKYICFKILNILYSVLKINPAILQGHSVSIENPICHPKIENML